MKKALFPVIVSLAAAVSLNAGTVSHKAVIVPASEDGMPTGAYGAVEGGLNFFQNGISSYGQDEVDRLGWMAGLKAGYEFGSPRDLVTPALELEGLYMNFAHHWDERVAGYGVTEKARVGTFAFMVNGIVNFNLGALQPYFGVGAGFYTAKAKFAEKVGDKGEFDDGSEDRDGFAWQALTGVDYYFTPTVSVFTEYKWLDCVVRNGGEFLGDGFLGQHLLTAGVRYHF